MKIYNYDKETKAYLNSIEAYEDPEASRRQGKFIPMMPANSTLLAPPDYDPQNQIPVFENSQWVIKADYRKNYKKVTDEFITEYIKDIGDITDGYVVTKELADEIDKNPDMFKIENGKVLKKSDEEYAEFEKKKKKESDIQEIKQQLAEIDQKRIRAMCEPSEYDGAEPAPRTVTTWLDFYNARVAELRNELKKYETESK